VSAQNNPDVEVEYATRYLCDNLDLQEREMFFVHYMTNASEKVLMPSEAGMPFPGHQVLRRQAHQMPQGKAYPAIHLENAARLFGDSVYAEEPEARFPQWRRSDYTWHKESPVYQRLTAENTRQVWRGWRAAGVNALAHWVLREGFAIDTQRADVAERLGIPAEVDPRRPGRSVVSGKPSRESFPLPGVDRELEGGRAYLEGVAPLTAWIGGGPGIRVFNKDHLFTAGRPVRKTIAVLNDFHETVSLNGDWQLVRAADGAVATSGPLRGEVTPGARALDAFVLAFDAPSVETRTDYVLSFRLASKQGELRDKFAITVFPEIPVRMPKTTRRIWLLGEERDGWVRALALNATRLTLETPPGTVRPDDVVIVPRNALSAELWRHHDLDARIDAGLRVLVLEQDLENILGLRTETVRPRRAFTAARGHPVLEGFSDGDFHFWTGSSDLQPDVPERNTPDIRQFPDRLWKVSNENAVATRTLLRPQGGAARALLVSGFDLQETPLLEVVRGRGRMLFCQLDVSNRFLTDPVASRLLIRLVAYADTAAPPDPARSEVTVIPPGHPSVDVVTPLYRAEPPTGPTGWGVTRAELFFRESIYEKDWITRQAPVLPVPVFAGGARDVVRSLPDGRLATPLRADLFSTGWGRQKMLFLHSALRINQGGSSSEGPGLANHGNPDALYPESWRSGFVHPYTAACW
jgi:beta-galactosidase